MVIRLELVDEDGALLAPVPGQVALTVSDEIHPANAAAPWNRGLPDARMDSAPLPFNVARNSDVHR